ncbi:15406_t:CDS:2, partial [Racocetra persica]
GIDCEHVARLLREMELENLKDERKRHFKLLLQDNNKMHFVWNELKSLVDANILHNKFKEQTDWKKKALSNIGTIKEKIKDENTSTHERLFAKLCKVDIEGLTCDDPLYISVIDLGSDKYKLFESDYDVLVGQKAGIIRLNKDALIKNVCANFVIKREEAQRLYKFVLAPTELVMHDQWVEQNHDRERVAKGITDVLLQEIKTDILRRVDKGLENTLVGSIARLIDATMYRLPIGCEIEVTRGERQSIASKNRKVKQSDGARGDKPDLMIRAFLRQKWNEVVYFESGRWSSTDKKKQDDHNKLAQLCLDGYKEIKKKCVKQLLHERYIAFGVNIAGEYIVIHGLVWEKDVRYYLPIARAKIPFNNESTEEVEEFIHSLMVLRNGLIVNLQNLTNSFQTRTK